MTTPLGRYLQDQLNARGLTGEQFAPRADLSVSVIYQIIRGDKEHPRRDTVEKIARGLGMSLAELERAIDPQKLAEQRVDAELAIRMQQFQELLDRGYPRSMLLSVLDANRRMAELTLDSAPARPAVSDVPASAVSDETPVITQAPDGPGPVLPHTLHALAGVR